MDGGMDGWKEEESASYKTSNFTWLAVTPRSCTPVLTADLTAECRGRAAAQSTAHEPRRKKEKEIRTPPPPPLQLPYAALALHTLETVTPGITPPRAQWHAKVNTHVLVPEGGAEAQVRYICAVVVNAPVHTLRRRHRSITSSEMTVWAFNRLESRVHVMVELLQIYPARMLHVYSTSANPISLASWSPFKHCCKSKCSDFNSAWLQWNSALPSQV